MYNCFKVNNEEFYEIPTQHRQIAAIGLENIFKKIQVPPFDLETLLTTSVFGQEILDFYRNKKSLTGKLRNRLTDIIIKHLFNYIAQQ